MTNKARNRRRVDGGEVLPAAAAAAESFSANEFNIISGSRQRERGTQLW